MFDGTTPEDAVVALNLLQPVAALVVRVPMLVGDVARLSRSRWIPHPCCAMMGPPRAVRIRLRHVSGTTTEA